MISAQPGPPAAAWQARRAALLLSLQQLPPRGSRPLTIAGRVAGWVTAHATRALSGVPGVQVEDEAVHVLATPSPGRPLDTVLAGVARALDEAGCVRAWRGELIDVVAEGRRLGAIERGAVRPLGLLTHAVHLNAWTPGGEVWIARRAQTKSTDPGKWDTLAGGLASSGESFDAALVRESGEEAGMDAPALAGRSRLRVLLRLHKRVPEGYQVEDVLASECVLPPGAAPLNRDGEVSEFRCVGVPELWSLIEADAFTVEAELVLLEGLLARFSTTGSPPGHRAPVRATQAPCARE